MQMWVSHKLKYGSKSQMYLLHLRAVKIKARGLESDSNKHHLWL